MSAPTAKKPPAKKTAGKAGPKRSPRAARLPDVPPEVTDEDLDALAGDQADDELADGEIRPVIIGKRGRRGDAPVEMVTLFELDDVPYQIPRNPSAALVLTWMLDLRKDGIGRANEQVGVTLLGEGPLRALAASPEVEPEDLQEIFINIGTVFFTSENYRTIMEAPDPS